MALSPESYALAGTEHAHQVAFFMWAALNFEQYPVLRSMFAIPNGGKRDLKTASILKAEGVKAGVPDVFLPVPRGKWHGLFIELKRPESIKNGKKKTKGTASGEQKEMHVFLKEQDYGLAVAVGWEQARDITLQYLNWKD